MTRLMAAFAIVNACRSTPDCGSSAGSAQHYAGDASATAYSAEAHTIPYRVRGSANGTSLAQVLYVMAVGGDAPTAQKLVAALSYELQLNRDYLRAYYQEYNNKPPKAGLQLVTVIPEPLWAVSDYVKACLDAGTQQDQQTAGAVIVYVAAVSSYTIPHILYGRTNHTEVAASLAYSRCTAAPVPSSSPSPAPGATTAVQTIEHKGRKTTITNVAFPPTPPQPKRQYYIGFQSTVENADGLARVFTALPVIGFLLSGISAWTQLTPSITKSTTNVVTFPTPSPRIRIPPNGYVGTSTTVNSKVTNPAQISGLATGFLGSSLTYDQTVESVPTSDLQGLYAARNLSGQFISVLKCPVGDATPVPAPSAPPTPIPPAPDTATPTDPGTPACLDILRGNDITLEQTTELTMFRTIPKPPTNYLYGSPSPSPPPSPR